MSVPLETPIEAWKRHVLQCDICAVSKSMGDLCLMGQQFWRPSLVTQPEPARAPEPPPRPRLYATPPAPPPPAAPPSPAVTYAPYVPPYAPPPPPPPQSLFEQAIGGIPVEPQRLRYPTVQYPYPSPQSNLPQRYDNGMVNQIAERVIARSQSGAAMAIPMEKTSTAVSFSTAPGVLLRMPERDIEVYAEMKGMIGRLIGVAERIGKTMMVTEESRRYMAKANPEKPVNEEELSLVVRQVGGHFGGISEEDLFYEFEEVASSVVRLGDRLGNFMRVDEETQRVMKRTRALAIDMRGELERSYGGKLPMDAETRKLVREARMVALDLQAEIERRIGT